MSGIDLQARMSGIGGSDVAAVLGLSKWKTPYDLFLEKTGKVKIDDDSKAELFHWGHVLEDVVAQEFSRRNEVKVQRRNAMFRHPQHAELIGNIDRYIVGGGVLECKTADKFTAHLWGDDNSENVPDYYLVQLMHYLFVTGQRQGWLAVLIGGNEFRQYQINYDSVLAEGIAERCLAFWHDHVLANVPPPAITAEDLKKMYRSIDGKTVTANDRIIAACEGLKTLKERKKAVEVQIDNLEFEIKNFMADNEVLLGQDGKKLATWKSGSRKNIDTKKLEMDFPEIHFACQRVSETRTFLLK